MADILMNLSSLEDKEDLINPFHPPGVDVIETLKSHYKNKFK